jgi:hypothetical protein
MIVIMNRTIAVLVYSFRRGVFFIGSRPRGVV